MPQIQPQLIEGQVVKLPLGQALPVPGSREGCVSLSQGRYLFSGALFSDTMKAVAGQAFRIAGRSLRWTRAP
jgi:hypothetical protein